ncbi:MAG: transcription termination factor Rho, partial [Gemmataceae bacterium]
VNSQDPYVPAKLIKDHGLRQGLHMTAVLEPARRGSGPCVAHLERIEGMPPSEYVLRPFESLTPLDPHVPLRLETGPEPLTTRVMDLFNPIGKGSRGLIVAPPRTGKTILLHEVANAVARNNPEMDIFLLLIDERPEEVTELRRSFQGKEKVEVIASNNDQDTASHIRIAELVMDRAKRLAEMGRQVFVLLDSLTRLARAYNRGTQGSGRTLSGGVDSRALEIPKRLFGSARVFEEGGSITVLGTALIETGSRMDDLIFQEFKGTGNMELVLNRKLADRRIFPALDVGQSGTRKEERLLDPEVLGKVRLLRRMLVDMDPVQGMESFLKKLKSFPSNEEFLRGIKSPG